MEIRRLTIADCGEQATLDDMKNRLLEMLKVLSNYCDNNGIRYYLSGGTLLGAVRHQGFIPWDDDIDLNAPRPDCEKLQKISGGRIGDYVLQRPEEEDIAHSEFWRLYDFSMIIENRLGDSTHKPFYTPIFIDIFPIDGLPADDKKMAIHFRKIKTLRFFMYSGLFNAWKGRTLTRKLAHLVARPVAKIIGVDTLLCKIQKIAQEYPFDSSDLVGVSTSTVHSLEERVSKEEYIPYHDFTFCGSTFHGPANYDTYLSQLYGKDYMQMPPADKQKSHHSFKIFYNKNI